MPRGVIHPDSRIRTYWDFFMISLLGYVAASVKHT